MAGKNNNNNGGGGGRSSSATTSCGVYELLIFLTAIVTGTACSICSKTMMELHGVGITGEVERFTKPLFQTFGMFVGMLFGLVMHGAVLAFRIPFPGYEHPAHDDDDDNTNNSKPLMMNYGATSTKEAEEGDRLLAPKKPMPRPSSSSTNNNNNNNNNSVPVWMYFFLAIPSIFDLAATALCMMGLRYLDVSIYQLLRGSGIIFVALMKQEVLKHHLYCFQWWGVAWNVVSVFLVGATAVLNSATAGGGEEDNSSGTAARYGGGEALWGVILVMMGAFVQALQFVFEEKVMTMDEAAAPPLLLVGMEGLWGTLLCLFVLYPLAYYCPGDDHGSFEDPFNTWHMIMNSSTIQWAFLVYFFSIFGYNLFAVLVTFSLNSIWHAILDNFRPITVWGTDMIIFYGISMGQFGEPWTKYSWVQLFGMFVLLYGTAVYNAPNAGSIKLLGQWYAFGVNLSDEYDAAEAELEEERLDQEWEERRLNFEQRRTSSFAEVSPYVVMRTSNALRSPRI